MLSLRWLTGSNTERVKMFVICNWCGMMFKENDCIKNKFAYTGYFCKECFKTYEDEKLLKGSK